MGQRDDGHEGRRGTPERAGTGQTESVGAQRPDDGKGTRLLLSCVRHERSARRQVLSLVRKGADVGLKKKICLLILVAVIAVTLTGCMEQEADKVTRNLSLQADNFNVTRRVTVYNCRTDKILLEVVGNLTS